MVTRTRESGTAAAPDSDVRGAPWIFALECVCEIEDTEEIVARIMRLTDEQSHVDEREDDVANIARAAQAPMFEHEAGSHAEALQREFPTGVCEFRAGDVSTFEQPLLAMLKRRQYEEICALFEPWFTQTNLLHDTVAKRQLSHSPAPSCVADTHSCPGPQKTTRCSGVQQRLRLVR